MVQRMMYKCIPITGKKNNSFVGIRANKSLVEIYYPESLSLSDEETERRQEILALIKSISLAKTKYGETTNIYEAKNVGNNFVVEAFLWILDDYMQYGHYVNVEKDYLLNARGKINWKRTIRQAPIVSEGNIVFKNVVSDVRHQQDNLLTEIYKYCVRIAASAIGWLIGVVVEENETIPFNKKVYESAIQKELESTFNDDKRKRLNVMKAIVTEVSSEEDFKSSFSYGVNDYSYVYERMVDNLYGNVKEIQNYYPNGEWELTCFDKTFLSSNLRPDTIINVKEGIFVLDAKFYRFGTTKMKGDLPNTSSIQKQITYGEFISHVFNPEKVVNAFVMPYDKKNNMFGLKKDVECIGASTARWKKQEHSYEYVFALLVDTRFLLLNWYKGNDSYRHKLVSLLSRKTEELFTQEKR